MRREPGVTVGTVNALPMMANYVGAGIHPQGTRYAELVVSSKIELAMQFRRGEAI